MGKGNPNYLGYSAVSHFWRQNGPDGEKLKHPNRRIPMMDYAGGSFWSHTFHTYALRVTEEETTYYMNGEVVLNHPTGKVSKAEPHFFMVNYAIGGISGWRIDMERYGNVSDMYVDYIRAFQGRRP